MDAKRSGTVLLILIAVIVILWGLLSFFPYGVKKEAPDATGQSNASKEQEPDVVLRRSVSEDAVTYTGELALSSCMELSSGVRSNGFDPLHVSIFLETVKTAEPCAENSSGGDFSVSVTKGDSQEVLFDGVYINGELVPARIEE